MRRERMINRYVIISIVAVSVVIISAIGIIIANSSRKANENKFAEEISSLNKEMNESETASTQIGKSVDESKKNEIEFETLEVQEDKKENTNTNTTNKENKKENTNTNIASKENNKNKNTNNTSENKKTNKSSNTVETNAKTEKKEQSSKEKDGKIELEAPVKGQVIREFAKESLVFSNTLQEWITHNGVDIKADKTTVVKSAASGTVTAIKNDPRYGLTVIINHDNGYQTIYSNLLTAEFVVKGEKVEKGQSIGTVGNSASFEVADDYHLHFELLKNNEYLDPTVYISFE